MAAHTEIETTRYPGTSGDLEQPSTVEATQSHHVKTIKQTLSKLPRVSAYNTHVLLQHDSEEQHYSFLYNTV